MAIQIPKISADQPINASPAPRIQDDVPNAVAPMQKQQSALEGAGREIIRYRDQMAYQESDNKGTQRDNEFQDWFNKEKYGDPATGKIGLVHQEGDPKKLYADFDKKVQEKLNEYSSPDDGESWSDQTQNVVNRRLNHRAQQLHNETLNDYGNQKYKFDVANRNTAVDFAQKAMPSASAQIDPDHPETFGPLQAKIGDIERVMTNHALQYQGAVPTEDGGVILTPNAKQDIQKAVSDGLYKTIDNLYNSDQGDGVSIKKGDAIKDQFADKLDPFHKDTLNDKAAKAVIKQQAYSLATKIMGSENPEAVLNSSDASPEVKDLALAKASEQRSHLANLKRDQAATNYKLLFNHIDSVQQSDQPFSGIQALTNDPVYKATIDKLTPAQVKNVENMVQAPKNSSDSSLNKVVNLFMGKDPNHKIGDLDPATFRAEYLSGLAKPEQRKYEAMYEKLKMPGNQALEGQNRLFAKELDDQAIGARLLRKMPNSTFLTTDDQIKEKLMRKELLDSIADLPIMSPKERSDYVAKYISDKQAGKAFQPLVKPKFNGGTKNPPPAPVGQTPGQSPTTDVSKVYGSLTPAARMDYAVQYRAIHHIAPSEPQLIEFIGQQISKKGP